MNAVDDKATLEVMHAAQQGCEKSLARLAEEAKGKVFALLYRATLNRDLAEDLTQETLLEMIQSLKRLHLPSAKSFWAWLYRTALGKMQHHYRVQGNKRIAEKTAFDTEFLADVVEAGGASPQQRLLQREGLDRVWAAMSDLKSDYRTVLTLRCVEGLSYAQIAHILGGTQIRVRMLYQRAKRSLKQQLARQGLSQSYFAEVMAAFAVATALPGIQAPAAKAVALKSFDAVLQTTARQGAVAKVLATAMVAIATVVLVVVATSGTPASNPQTTTPPPPVFDATLGAWVYDDPASGFASVREVVTARNTSDEGWMCFEIENPSKPAVLVYVPELLSGFHMLVLPEGSFIEYRLPDGLIDRPGVDVTVMFYVWGRKPQILFIDQAGEQLELSLHTYQSHPNGFHIHGFDIAGASRPFKALRITGLDSAGPHGGCGLGPLRAYTGQDTSRQATQPAESTEDQPA
jgi:RNA polymerase sigma-70 factor, ECF subfamily